MDEKTVVVIGLPITGDHVKVSDLVEWISQRDAACAEYLLPELQAYLDERANK